MASIFKQQFKRRDGTKGETNRWYASFMDHRGHEQRVPGYIDKRASEELGRKLERLAGLRASREQPDKALSEWIESLPHKLRVRLVRFDLLDSRAVASGQPLANHLKDYKRALLDKGNTPTYAQLTTNRIQAILDGTGAKYLSELKAAAVARHIAKLRECDDEGNEGISIASTNHYLRSIKGLCAWLVKERRASENPLLHLSAMNADTDKRHVRRALEADELQRLMTKTRPAGEGYGMTGEERYWLYRLAAETGLRASELRSLTRASFNLSEPAPTVTVEAGYSKRRRQDTLPIRPETAKALHTFLSSKLPAAPVFAMPPRGHVAEMLRADLTAAGIPYSDDAGRVFDFHGFRVSYATLLIASGTDVKTAQELLRHSTPVLTLGTYAKRLRGSERRAIALLPDFHSPTRETAQATGTDGEPVTTDDLQTGLQKHSPTQDNPVRGESTAIVLASASQPIVNKGKSGEVVRVAAHRIDRPRSDSNRRITDLQSVPLNHLGTRPVCRLALRFVAR